MSKILYRKLYYGSDLFEIIFDLINTTFRNKMALVTSVDKGEICLKKIDSQRDLRQ